MMNSMEPNKNNKDSLSSILQPPRPTRHLHSHLSFSILTFNPLCLISLFYCYSFSLSFSILPSFSTAVLMTYLSNCQTHSIRSIQLNHVLRCIFCFFFALKLVDCCSDEFKGLILQVSYNASKVFQYLIANFQPIFCNEHAISYCWLLHLETNLA